MAFSKKDEFSEEEIKIAGFAKALAHPARVAIIKKLMTAKCICGDIVKDLPLSQSTVSQHLKELKDAGLIKGEIEGTKICYCIDAENWKYVSEFFNNFIDRVCSAECNC
ncbi:MAG TPA: metalloregulator ArsR/SmtB family transcription factor [Ignavibacteria bacterium]|nr:metalloregulator ArsR/SmtB family transcription factor [Ignavibacteria bacterium]